VPDERVARGPQHFVKALKVDQVAAAAGLQQRLPQRPQACDW